MWRVLVVCASGLILLTTATGCGDSSSATAPVSFHDQVAQALREPSADVRVQRLVAIADSQVGVRDRYGAEATLKQALLAAGEVADPAEQAAAYAAIAEGQARAGGSYEAGRTAGLALAAAEKVADAEAKGRSLARVGRAQAAVQDKAAAARSLAKAEELAGALTDVYGRTLVFCDVAEGYARLGRDDEADRVLAAALSEAGKSDNPRRKCESIAAVATQQHALGRAEAATSFDAALEAAREIEDLDSRTYALTDLAQRLSRAGRHAQVHAVLDEADRTAHRIGEPDLQEQARQQVRSLMAKLPKPSP